MLFQFGATPTMSCVTEGLMRSSAQASSGARRIRTASRHMRSKRFTRTSCSGKSEQNPKTRFETCTPGSRGARAYRPRSRQKSPPLFGCGKPARIKPAPDPIPRRGNHSVKKVANRRRTKAPDPRQPTVSWQAIQNTEDSVTPLEQLPPLRTGPINENRVDIHRLGVISRYSLERFPLQR